MRRRMVAAMVGLAVALTPVTAAADPMPSPPAPWGRLDVVDTYYRPSAQPDSWLLGAVG